MEPLTLIAQSTVNATGKVVLQWAPVTREQWWHVACSVPQAPTATRFSLAINGIARLGWLGPYPSSAVVVSSGSTVTVTGSGLTPGTTVVGVLTGGWAAGPAQGRPPISSPVFTAGAIGSQGTLGTQLRSVANPGGSGVLLPPTGGPYAIWTIGGWSTKASVVAKTWTFMFYGPSGHFIGSVWGGGPHTVQVNGIRMMTVRVAASGTVLTTYAFALYSLIK